MNWTTGDLIEVARAKGIRVVGFSANAVITRDGDLVMGAGAARRIKNAYPGIERILGEAIGVFGLAPDYYLQPASYGRTRILAYQVKRDWRESGDFALTRESLTRLAEWSRANGPVVVNCPLIGAGGWGSRSDEVFEMVERALADADVTVCRL